MSYYYDYSMEFVLPNEKFSYILWHSLQPDGPGFDNWTDDDGDPIRNYNVRLLYSPYNFWFKIRVSSGILDDGEKVWIDFTRNATLKKVYIQTGYTVSGANYRILEFTFPYNVYNWTSHLMSSYTLDGSYSNATYNQSPPFSDEWERDGVEQPAVYWFLRMQGVFSPIHLPELPFFHPIARYPLPLNKRALSRTR